MLPLPDLLDSTMFSCIWSLHLLWFGPSVQRKCELHSSITSCCDHNSRSSGTIAAELNNSESLSFDHNSWYSGTIAAELHNSWRSYTTRWVILFWTTSHGHEQRRMFEFSFIAADSEGVSLPRPARDQPHSALRSRAQFPQTSINATDEAFKWHYTFKRTIQ